MHAIILSAVDSRTLKIIAWNNFSMWFHMQLLHAVILEFGRSYSCYLAREFWVLCVLGYLATSGAKSDVGFLLGDPDFLLGRRNCAPILLSYRDPHFGLFGFWVFLGYLATSGAKSDVIFLIFIYNFITIYFTLQQTYIFSSTIAFTPTQPA